MSRPHEDRENHTLVDHRGGGSPVAFAPKGWVAIGVARVRAERNDACVAAYETLVEKALTSNVHGDPAIVFASDNGRRVIVMLGVLGHEAFGHLSAAWDDHHRNQQHRVISESVSFALYKVVAHAGIADIDPAASDAYEYERLERPVSRVNELCSSLDALPDFRGATVLYDEVASATVIVSRFSRIAAYDAFRTGPEAVELLGTVDEPGRTSFPIRTSQDASARSAALGVLAGVSGQFWAGRTHDQGVFAQKLPGLMDPDDFTPLALASP